MSKHDGSDDQRRERAAELLALQEKPLGRFVGARVRNPEDAKEIAQEVRARYLKALQSGAVMEDEVKYFFGIADKVIRDHWRKKASAQKVFAPPDPEGRLADAADARPGPESEEEDRQQDELLREAIQSLNPVQRAMILLKHEGSSVEEAAHRCGLSKHQANRVLHDARTAIREFFKRHGKG